MLLLLHTCVIYHVVYHFTFCSFALNNTISSCSFWKSVLVEGPVTCKMYLCLKLIFSFLLSVVGHSTFYLFSFLLFYINGGIIHFIPFFIVKAVMSNKKFRRKNAITCPMERCSLDSFLSWYHIFEMCEMLRKIHFSFELETNYLDN